MAWKLQRGGGWAGSPGPWAGALLVAVLLHAAAAEAQLSPDSWWPKFQRDAQNSGYVPLLGFAADAHVIWSAQLSEPIDPVTGARHAMPVFSPDNSRLYVGGPASTLTAVQSADGVAVWTLTLGDGTGVIHQTPVIGADGSIYAGPWDSQPPFDGFSKIRDEGSQAMVLWTFPMHRLLASPTITSDGLIVVGGQHEDGRWAYFALEDLGDSYSLAWVAGELADPGDPTSTGVIGSSPAVSLDGTWIFGGSFENTTFWQIDAQTGFEAARLPLDFYCYAPSPVVSDDGFAFIGEGMSFVDPDQETQGKLYVFEGDQQGIVDILDSQPLRAGHLQGGTAALRRRANGQLRLYVPANGGYAGASSASLVAVDFDPDGPQASPPEPALVKVWETSIGGWTTAYPQAVITRDELVYVLGPANQRLYAIRDADDQATGLWSVLLEDVTRASEWQLAGQLGPQGVVVGPDGTIYWNAVDGYLYAIRGWLTGDLDADGQLTDQDFDWLVTALLDPEQYAVRFPEIDATEIGDVNGDGRLDFFDLNRMLELLAGE